MKLCFDTNSIDFTLRDDHGRDLLQRAKQYQLYKFVIEENVLGKCFRCYGKCDGKLYTNLSDDFPVYRCGNEGCYNDKCSLCIDCYQGKHSRKEGLGRGVCSDGRVVEGYIHNKKVDGILLYYGPDHVGIVHHKEGKKHGPAITIDSQTGQLEDTFYENGDLSHKDEISEELQGQFTS